MFSFFKNKSTFETNVTSNNINNNISLSNDMKSWFSIAKPNKFSEMNDPKEISTLLNISTTNVTPNDLISILKRSIELKDDEFTISTLDYVYNVIEISNTEFKLSLFNQSIVLLLEQILNQRNMSVTICENCFKIICSLLSDESNRLKFSSSSFCFRLVKICQVHSSNMSLISWGLRVLRYLTLENSLISKFTMTGLCEIIPSILDYYKDKDDNDIIELCCKIIYNLCYDEPLCCTKFSESGTIEIILQQLRKPNQSIIQLDNHKEGLSDVMIWSLTSRKAQYLLLAIGGLARRHEQNKNRLGILGICDIIMDIVNYFTNEDVGLAESICWACGNLAYPNEDNQRLLCDIGICKVIIEILVKHIGCEQCTIECLRAIRNIAHNSDSALESFHQSDISSSIITVLKFYTDSNAVVQWGWYALASLAEHPTIRSKLGEIDICKIAGDVLSRYKSFEDIIQWVAMAISQLSIDPILNQKLCSEGIVTLLVEAMSILQEHPEVIEECCFTISSLLSFDTSTNSNISINSSSHVSHFKDGNDSEKLNQSYEDIAKFYIKQDIVNNTNICELIIKFLVDYDVNEHIVQESLNVLSTLMMKYSVTTESYEVYMDKLDHLISHIIINKLLSNNIIKILPKLLYRYIVNINIINSGFNILSTLVSNLESTNKIKLGNHTPIFIVLAIALYIHIDYVNICELGLNICTHICTEAVNLNKMSNSFGTINSTNNLINNSSFYSNTISDNILTLSRNSIVSKFLSIGSNSAQSPTSNNNNSNFESIETSSTNIDCPTVIVNILLRHYQYYYNNEDVDSSQPSNESVEDSNNRPTVISTSPIVNKLVLQSIQLISDLCSRNNTLQQRFGNVGAGKAVAIVMEYHQSNQLIIIKSCIMITNLISTMDSKIDSSTDSAIDSPIDNNIIISNALMLYNNNIHVIIYQLYQYYSSNHEILYFITLCINSLTIIDAIRIKFHELNIPNLILISLSKYSQVEGLVTIGLSTIGSIYDNGLLIPYITNQTIDSLTVNITVLSDLYYNQYTNHSIIIECICRFIAYITSTNQTIQNLFYQNNYVVILLDILDKFINHMDNLDTNDNISINTLKFCLLAISEITYNNSIISSNLCNNLLCEKVVIILKKYYKLYDYIVEVCCRILVSLGSQYSNRFGKLGICELVLNSLDIYIMKEPVVEWICKAIGILAENKDNVMILCINHAPETIVKTLLLHIQNDSSIYNISKKVFAIKSTNNPVSHTTNTSYSNYIGIGNTTIIHSINSNHHKLINNNKSTNTVTNLLSMISNFKYSSNINVSNPVSSQANTSSNNNNSILWGILAIYFLLRGSDYNPTYQNILDHNNICDILSKLLYKYYEYDVFILACIKAVVSMIKSNVNITNKVGNLGIGNQIIEIMQLYPSSLKITKWGCRAIGLLCMYENENVIAKLASAGICETVPVAIQAHQTSEEVALHGCEIIFYITTSISNGLGGRLGHSGACEAVVSVLRKHSSVPNVVEIASKAISNLALVTGNSAWLGPAGACDALLAVIKEHEKLPDVIGSCWLAVSTLCSIDHNRMRLWNLGVCDLLVSTIRDHRSSCLVAENGSKVVGKLCEYRNINQNLLARFNEYPTFFLPNPPDEMNSIKNQSAENVDSNSDDSKESNIDSYDIASTATIDSDYLTTLRGLLALTPGNRLSLYDAGIIEQLLSILSIHIQQGQIVYNILKTISILANGKDSILERYLLYCYKSYELVHEALDIHKNNISICIVGLQVISVLCNDNYLSNDVRNDASISNNQTNITYNDLLSITSSIQSNIQEHFHEQKITALLYELLNIHINTNNLINNNIYKSTKVSDLFIESFSLSISNLCNQSSKNRETLGQLGICEMLVNILISYIKHNISYTYDNIYYLIMAITQLSINCNNNIIRFAFSNLSECITIILQKYFIYFGSYFDSTTNHSTTNSNNITSLGNLPNNLTSNTNNNSSNGLSINVNDNSSLLSTNNYDILIEYILILVSNLCSDKVGQHKLSEYGLNKLLIQLLHKYEKSLFYSGLICMSIAAFSYKSADNVNKLLLNNLNKSLIGLYDKYIYGAISNSDVNISLTNETRPSIYIDGLVILINITQSNDHNKLKLQNSIIIDILTFIISLDNKQSNYTSDYIKYLSKYAMDSIMTSGG